jgi:hypothetical protein
MRQGTCFGCGLTTSIRSFYSFQERTYCEPCVWKASREAKEKGEPSEYASLTDNSVCARCGISSGDAAEHPLIGKLPLCATCAPQVSNWPYPVWLKASLAALVILLAFALVHGRKYFHAGRTMYIGERLVRENHFAEALPYLLETISIAPQSDKAVLLAAMAALKSGDPDAANRAFQGHNGGHFEDGNDESFLEVKAVWERAMAAVDKANAADKLAEQDGHEAEAAQLMHEAAAAYPEAAGLAISAEYFDEGAAFERKDYDTFLSLTQKLSQKYPNANTSASVASALACKYAVTGDITYRKRAEDMLQKAEQQSQGNEEAMKSFQEYSERIRFRLDTRQIMDKREYDRKYHSGQNGKK